MNHDQRMANAQKAIDQVFLCESVSVETCRDALASLRDYCQTKVMAIQSMIDDAIAQEDDDWTPPAPMTRADAEAVIAPHIQIVNETYQSVKKLAAVQILGIHRAGRLDRDKVRGVGPTADTFYPWSVVDYLADPFLNEPWISK